MYAIRVIKIDSNSPTIDPKKMENDIDREMKERRIHSDSIINISTSITSTRNMIVYVFYKGHAREPGEE